MGFDRSVLIADPMNLIGCEFLPMILKGMGHRSLADFFGACDSSQ